MVLDSLDSDNSITDKPIKTLQNVKAINGKKAHQWVGVLLLYRLMNTCHKYHHRIRVSFEQGCVRYGPGMLGTGWMSYGTYRSVRYRHWCRTELAELSGTGIDVVPTLSKCPVPVWKSVPVPAAPVSMSYRTYRRVRYRYWCRTELTEVSGTGKTGGIHRRYMPRYVPGRTHPSLYAVQNVPFGLSTE